MFDLKLKGRFKLTRLKGEEVVEETAWSDNLVLDNGLLHLGSQNVRRYCRVGSGSSEPRKEQVELDAQIASTGGRPPLPFPTNPETGVNTQDGYFYWRDTFRFATGVAAGRISEVGVGWDNTGATLFNRALIRDARGSRATITVLDDETLDVVVEIRCYVSVSPQQSELQSIVRQPDGSDKITNYTVKSYPLLTTPDYRYMMYKAACHKAYGYSGPVNSTLALAAGYIDEFKTITNMPYQNDHAHVFEIYWSINQGNGLPLRTVMMETSFGNYMVEITPAFPKTNQYVLRLEFKMTWSRYD